MRLDPLNKQELSVGIDIGGTFTDAVLYDNQKTVSYTHLTLPTKA